MVGQIINPIELLLKITERLDKIDSQMENISKQLNDIVSNKRINRMMTVKETCKYLNISTRTLQVYRDQGLIDFIQVGRKVNFRSGDVEKFLEGFHIKSRRR